MKLKKFPLPEQHQKVLAYLVGLYGDHRVKDAVSCVDHGWKQRAVARRLCDLYVEMKAKHVKAPLNAAVTELKKEYGLRGTVENVLRRYWYDKSLKEFKDYYYELYDSDPPLTDDKLASLFKS